MTPDRQNSITDVLWEMGVTHERDTNSRNDGKHVLYFAGRAIGRYSAAEVCALLREVEPEDRAAAEDEK